MQDEAESKHSYEIKNDYSYATGRARALEARIRAPELMDPAQVMKEYGLAGEDMDARLEELLEKDLKEFEEQAPEAVIPFRIMADLTNFKAFVRMKKTGEKLPYSPIGSIAILEEVGELRMNLRESGWPELADALPDIISMGLKDADLALEAHFTGKIKNALFLDYISLKKNYLKSEEKPERFYVKLERFLKERSVTKNMDLDIPTAFLLLRQRELELARARALNVMG